MKIYTLKDVSMHTQPLQNTLAKIWEEHAPHCITFPNGEIGFLIKPRLALVARTNVLIGRESTVRLADGSVTYAHCLGQTKIPGVGAWVITDTLVSENLTFRRQPCSIDTFIFRLDVVNDSIRCSRFVNHDIYDHMALQHTCPADFLPVFDWQRHFVGLTIGRHNGVHIAVDAHNLAQLPQ